MANLYLSYIALAFSLISSSLAVPVNTGLESGISNQRDVNVNSSRTAGKRIGTQFDPSKSEGKSSAIKETVDLNLHLGHVKDNNIIDPFEAKHFGPLQMIPTQPNYRRLDLIDDADSREQRLERKAKYHDVWMPGFKYNPNIEGNTQDKKQHKLFYGRKSGTIKRVRQMIERRIGSSSTKQSKDEIQFQVLQMARQLGMFHDTQQELYEKTKHWSEREMRYHIFKQDKYDNDWNQLIQHVVSQHRRSLEEGHQNPKTAP